MPFLPPNQQRQGTEGLVTSTIDIKNFLRIARSPLLNGWLGSRVVSVLDSGEVGPGFKSQS